MEDIFRFKVNLGGMIDILGNHLYSSQDVFIRELLQNSVDAINKRKQIEKNWTEGKVCISLLQGKDTNTIVFEDNGTGLTEAEIHKFLAIIGESSKKDIMDGIVDESYIGRFGIGLLSCFMVSDEIDVVTRSIKDNISYHWKGKPDGTYTLNKLEANIEAGTTIYLKCKKGSEKYFTRDKLIGLVKYYGLLLPVPIYLNVDDKDIKLNLEIPPWDDMTLSPQEILEFGEDIFLEEFLDYIPIYSKTGGVKGFAYIIPHKVVSSENRAHRIYLKNMLLTEKGQDLLPNWAFFVKCILNANELTPTASRESFCEDETLEKTKEELGKCIINYLSRLSKIAPKKLSYIIDIHSLAIKSLAVEEDNVYKEFIDYLTFPTSKGNKTGYELRTSYEKVIYTYSVDEFRQMSSIFVAQDKLLVNAGYIYDKELLEKMPILFKDVSVELITGMDLYEIMEDVTFEEQERAYMLLKIANITLNEFKCEVDIKKFSPQELPVLYTIDEDAMIYRNILKDKEEVDNSFVSILDGFIEEFEDNSYAKLYFNINNPLINKLISLEDKIALSNCIKLIYVQALLIGHFPLRNNEMKTLNNGIESLIEWGLSK
ncbi:HSP90 family protein [Tissierella sp. MSJ-40]|uniref:HSP90 family protein n=1 Tax=Tissierella simiarum TaxID=2841534 RepID=A0ABS6E0Q0_9FIRM|nr:HSP90 family protein [Tissierella simiarum]MBU5436472.1 HSP90 family protein [Tissierella simiarum]